MKINIPAPVLVAAVAVVVIAVGVLFLKGAGGETAAPKPDPARFLPQGVSPAKTP